MKRKHAFACLLLTIFFVVFPVFTGFHFSSIFYIFTFLLCFTLPAQDFVKALHILTKVLAFIVAISLPCWLIHQFIHPFPLFSVIDISNLKGGNVVLMENYIFFVINGSADFDTLRFYAVFDEPGVLGTLSAFILYGNKYNFKKISNIIILLGALFTFSLAFYVLFAIGFFYMSIKTLKNSKLTIAISLVVLAVSYEIIKENPVFEQVVLARFENGVADNLERRTGYESQRYYEKIMWTPEFFLGMGTNKMNEKGLKDGASHKLFIMENGFLALLSLMFAYYTLIRRKSLQVYVFYLILCLSFLQRPKAFTAYQMFMFECVMCTMLSDVPVIKKKKKVLKAYDISVKQVDQIAPGN